MRIFTELNKKDDLLHVMTLNNRNERDRDVVAEEQGYCYIAAREQGEPVLTRRATETLGDGFPDSLRSTGNKNDFLRHTI